MLSLRYLDCPRKNERFVQNYVDECMLFDRFAMRIFVYSRTVEDARPYNQDPIYARKSQFIFEKADVVALFPSFLIEK